MRQLITCCIESLLWYSCMITGFNSTFLIGYNIYYLIPIGQFSLSVAHLQKPFCRTWRHVGVLWDAMLECQWSESVRKCPLPSHKSSKVCNLSDVITVGTTGERHCLKRLFIRTICFYFYRANEIIYCNFKKSCWPRRGVKTVMSSFLCTEIYI